MARRRSRTGWGLWRVLLGLMMMGCRLTAVPPTDPVIPTRTPLSPATAVAASRWPHPLLQPTAVNWLAAPEQHSSPSQVELLARFGVLSDQQDIVPALEAGLLFGTLLNWKLSATLPGSDRFTFWQMIRLSEGGILFAWEDMAAIAQRHPGAVWVVGNEPDVRWQDNVTPERYAELYHEVYTFIKEQDPMAQLAIGGISQPTPLRLEYLERVLAAYQARVGTEMPIDIWTVHAFTLREEANSWGIGIPPGMTESNGRLYDIADHANMAILQQNIIDFRGWMAAHGYANRPLAVTEYGILLPSDYGFGADVVINFMQQSFDFFLMAANETGYAADNGRLVQWWFWYMVHDDEAYPTGNLYDRETGELTAVGQAYADYVKQQLGK